MEKSKKRIWLLVGISAAALVIFLCIRPNLMVKDVATEVDEEEAIEMAVELAEESYRKKGSYQDFTTEVGEVTLEKGTWTVEVYVLHGGLRIFNEVKIQPVTMVTGA